MRVHGFDVNVRRFARGSISAERRASAEEALSRIGIRVDALMQPHSGILRQSQDLDASWPECDADD